MWIQSGVNLEPVEAKLRREGRDLIGAAEPTCNSVWVRGNGWSWSHEFKKTLDLMNWHLEVRTPRFLTRMTGKPCLP
jgi:hypothetical protein